MKNIILKPVDIGDSGEQAKDKINETNGSITEAVKSLDQEVVKKVNISQALGFSQDKVPSEFAVSKSLAAKADKSEISNVVTALIYKDPVDNVSDLNIAYPLPLRKVGWAALVRNVAGYPDGAIFSWNGTEWANTGLSGFPHDVASKSVIFNISQANDVYDYADSLTARNAVTEDKRALGQIISYKLASQEWMTEQYTGTALSGWTAEGNWEKIGEIEISQIIDETTDKAISPEGVYRGLVDTGGFIRKVIESPEPDYTNMITSYDMHDGMFINNSGVEQGNGSFTFNAFYIPVVPGETYLTNIPAFNSPRFVGYNANKSFVANINQNSGSSIVIPDGIYYLRYNQFKTWTPEYSYLYKAPAPIQYDRTLQVSIGLENLKNATEANSVSRNMISNGLEALSQMWSNTLTPMIGVGYHSGNIAVAGGKTYYTNLPGIPNNNPLIWFFDKNNLPISAVIGSASTFTTPVNAAYLSFNSYSNSYDGYYIVDDTLKSYYIPNLFVPRDNIIDINDGSGFPKEYKSLGDSITLGGNGIGATYPVRLARELGFNLQNLAVSSTVISGLSSQINNIPDDFEGLITLMIGTNDYNRGMTLGDATEALSKTYEDLNVNNSSAEAFRWAVETIIRKAPKAVFVNIPPIHTGVHVTDSIQALRNMQHAVCDYFAVPCADIYKSCKIGPVTYPDYMSDGIHPNDKGHAGITRVLYPAVAMYLP